MKKGIRIAGLALAGILAGVGAAACQPAEGATGAAPGHHISDRYGKYSQWDGPRPYVTRVYVDVQGDTAYRAWQVGRAMSRWSADLPHFTMTRTATCRGKAHCVTVRVDTASARDWCSRYAQRNHFDADNRGKYVKAVAVTWQHRPGSAEICINDYFRTVKPLKRAAMYNAMLHEFGHALGMAKHREAKTSVMQTNVSLVQRPNTTDIRVVLWALGH